MIDIIAKWFVDVHPSKAKLTLFLDGNCILIEATESAHSLWQMIPGVLVESRNSSLRNALCDRLGSTFEIAFQGM